MIISIALTLLCTASGVVLTYLYDEGSSLSVRTCTGACVGLAFLGLVGFLLASFLGLGFVSIALTTATLVAAAFATLIDSEMRAVLKRDLSNASSWTRQALQHPTRVLPEVLFVLTAIVVLWQVFSRAVIEDASGLHTGVLNNFGDLPFHLSVITSFAFGDNFPPEDPTYAGVSFTYPFITDFVSAIFVRCGADLRQSMFIENLTVSVALVGLLHRWAWQLLRDRFAAFLTPVLVLLNCGLGWVLLWTKASEHQQGLWGILRDLPPSFTVIPETTWRWGNAISALLIPQRGILLGLALAVIVFTQWWMAMERPATESPSDRDSIKRKAKRKSSTLTKADAVIPLSGTPVRRMVAAGSVAGLLPLVHAHSFVVVMAVGAGIALLRHHWRLWLLFFAVASVVALPQLWWSTHASAVDASKFFAWEFGWDRGTDNAVWFWFKNTGLFIPLTIAAILWGGKKYLVSRRLLLYYLPFILCFLVPNVIKMAPWVWDNIKVLFYWWLASAPLVALLLAHLWRSGGWKRSLSIGLIVCVCLAGALDVVSISLRDSSHEVFNRNGIDFAEIIKRETEPRSLVVHAPVHNSPVFLTGRRSLMGYPGHIWTHGLEFTEREGQIRRIYSGSHDAMQLIQHHGIEYLVVGPQERNTLNVNEQFFARFSKVGETGAYRLYKAVTP